MNMKTSRLLLACALILLALITVVGAAAQTGATYFVSDVDGSGFPLVQFRLRAVDLDNKVVRLIMSSSSIKGESRIIVSFN
jgi:hypothetical protein